MNARVTLVIDLDAEYVAERDLLDPDDLEAFARALSATLELHDDLVDLSWGEVLESNAERVEGSTATDKGGYLSQLAMKVAVTLAIDLNPEWVNHVAETANSDEPLFDTDDPLEIVLQEICGQVDAGIYYDAGEGTKHQSWGEVAEADAEWV